MSQAPDGSFSLPDPTRQRQSAAPDPPSDVEALQSAALAADDEVAAKDDGDDVANEDEGDDASAEEAEEAPAADEGDDEVAAKAEEGTAEDELEEPPVEEELEEPAAGEEPEEVAELEEVPAEGFEDVAAEAEIVELGEEEAFKAEPSAAEVGADFDDSFAGEEAAAELDEDQTEEDAPGRLDEAAGDREPAEEQHPVAEHAVPPPPLDLGAWKPIERLGGPERLETSRAAADHPAAVAEAAEEPAAETAEVAEELGGEDEIAAEEDTDVEADAEDETEPAFEEEDEQLAAEEADAAAVLAAEMHAADARAEEDGTRHFEETTAATEPLEVRPGAYSDPVIGAAAAGVHGAARAFEPAPRATYRGEAMEPPRTAAEVYRRSSDALERLAGIRPDAAWLENEDIQYGADRVLESTFAESRSGAGRVDPGALELALGMAARGERVDDQLVAEAATAAVGVLHEALRSLGATSGARGTGDLFEDGATEAFIALHAEEWLAQLGFYDAFPGAQADPELSGERLARTYTWQTVAARGYLERFASAAGRLPGSVVDDFVKGGGGATGLTRLHLDYLRTQRRQGVEPDARAEATAAQRMTDDALRLVAELAGGGLRDPSSAGAAAAGIADQVMAGIAVAG